MSRVCLVTGASRGIGRAVAVALADRGDAVALLARPSPQLDAAASRCGPRCAAFPADVAERTAVEEAVAAVTGSLGPVEVLVSAAAVEPIGDVAELPVAELERTIGVNLLGTVYAVRAVLPGMLDRGRGAIVTFSSSAGDFPLPGGAVYAASKAGVAAFTEALHAEVAGRGVHAFVVSPGYVPGTGLSEEHARRRGRPPRYVHQSAAAVSAAVLRELDGRAVRLVLPRPLTLAPIAKYLAPRLALRLSARSVHRR